MSSKLDEKRLKLAAQGLRKTAISLQAAVVSLLRTAEALTAETDDNLVDNSPLDINLQDLLKGDINGALGKLLGEALNKEGKALDEDQKTQQNGKQSANGVKKPTRKPRPPRDPNAPTKPQNAFILYQKDVADQVKAENQGKPWSEIVHLISTRWKALSKEEKETYERQFTAAKKRFEVENKAYMESKDQEPAADADAPEEIINRSSATPNSTSSTSPSEDENEEDEEDTPNLSHTRASRSRAKPNAKNMPTSQTDPESSSKKKSKKRKPHEEDDNESAHEEEEYEKSPRKQKKKTSNEEEDEVKDRKKIKKSSREDEDKDVPDMAEVKKRKSKKNKKQD